MTAPQKINLEQTENESITRATYNRGAEDWIQQLPEHTDGNYWLEEFEILSRMLNPSATILDLGCGFARDHKLFTCEGYKYVGIDFSRALLLQAKNHFPKSFRGLQLIEGNMRAMPFCKNSFGGLWAVASLLHIEKHLILDVLKAIRFVLVDGAAGFISIKEGKGEKLVEVDRPTWDVLDRRNYSYYKEDEFQEILERSGFIVEKIRNRNRDTDTKWIEFFVRITKS